VLKALANELAPYLVVLFQQIIDTGVVPSDWKQALVVPIHKGGPKQSVDNYRPVSLTCLICKVFEHILYSCMIKHLLAHNLLASEQHGFSKNLSCETQTTALLHDLSKSMDDKKNK
jgi:ribonucleases P/MRP protein subunit RPP40